MASDFSKPREEIVLAMRDQAIVSAVEKWFWVIIDDTNFEEKHKDRVRELIKHRSIEFEEKFFDVPLSICLERNRARPNPVPDDVIISMAQRYNVGKEKPEFEKVIQDPTKELAIIVDIDWTIADKWDRSPYDWSKVSEDTPIGDIIELVRVLSETYTILFVSWRDFACAIDTVRWLDKNVIDDYRLLMRPEWDKRKDSIVKYELLQEIIKDYYVAYVLDDRAQVVKMWREAWLRCLQVAEGNF